MRHALRLATFLAASALAVGIARADIVIGLAGPLTGPFAAFGAEMRAGAEQAVADLNAAGGVNGEQLVLEVMDDGCTAKKADAVANQLAGKGAAVVIGHLCLKASIAGAAVYAAERIIEISPGTTFPRFTDERAGPGIFRVAGRDDAQGAFAGKAIAARYADKNVAVVDDKSAWGKGLADAAAAAMTAAGKQPILRDSYEPGDKEYATLVSRLEASAVDVLYLGGSNPEAALIAREIRARNMTTVIVSGDMLLTDEYWKLAGDAAEGTLVTFAPDAARAPAAAAVVAALTAKGIAPAGYTLPTYAAVQAWAAAATAAGSADFDKVIAALHAGTFKTVIGDIAFDEKGDLRDPVYDWYVWHDGLYIEQAM